jgi:hypothetical protein
MTYFPPDTQNGTIDPFPPTIISLNGVDYEYARRYGTLEDPPDLTSIVAERLSLVGFVTSATYIGLDINPTLQQDNTEYYGVYSRPLIDDADLSIQTHFYATGVPITAQLDEYYGFRNEVGTSLGITTHHWGVYINSNISNYFRDVVLVGDEKILSGSCGLGTYTPIVQIFNNEEYDPYNPRRGLYVEGPATIGGGGPANCSNSLHVNGDAKITGSLDVDGSASMSDAYVSNNAYITGSATANLFIGDVDGVASGNKVLPFDIPHVKQKGKRIRHIIAEGPEAGIYIRGKLKDYNVVELPEYWDGLVDPETITVTLTQIGYSQDLIVDRIEWGKKIIIRSGVGANINCYYEVWAARWLNPMDHEEKLHVVYDGETPDDYPGGNANFLIGGWDYDRRNPQWEVK